MTQLNQTTLRGILAQILSVDQKYVVPKQGNWWNPQKPGANVANWCAYRIRSNKPRSTPFYCETAEGVNSACVLKIADIDLQFVGPQSEQLAQSIALWPLRGDVQTALATVQGSIMYDGNDAVPSDFYQDGDNTIIAWNVQVSVLWYDFVATSQKAIMTIETGGQIHV